jgi:hypothetical protein
MNDPVTAVAEAYRSFARQEARGRSAAYESLAESVADDPAVVGDRGPRLESAIAAARRDPPAVHRGDLLTDLPALAAQAPAGATLVIYHTAVLYQVAPDEREQFAGAVRSLDAVWLSSEAPGILPGTAAPALDDQMCVIARDGRPIAFADSHGTWLQWRDQ